MPNKELPPPTNYSDPPDFWKLDEGLFEELSCSLMQEEEQIKVADIFGKRGQTQYGIDIEAERHDGGLDVAQCKCCEKFPPLDIAKAARAFLIHWRRVWKPRDVKRFILIVACNLRTSQRRTAIARWKAIFKHLGMEFEAWSNRIIRDKLRPHPGIVAYFFDSPEYWVKKICGQSLQEYSPPQTMAQGVSTIVETQMEHFSEVANKAAKKELDEINFLIGSGKPNSALVQVAKVKADSSLWALIDDETKAKALRVEASLLIDTVGGLEKAKSLVDEAESFHSVDGPSQLRALIAWREDGPEAALELMQEATSPADRFFKAGVLAALERYDDIEPEIDDIKVSGKDEANLWRLRSLARLSQGKLDEALKCISKAYEITPESYIVRHMKGALEFYSAISPILTPSQILSYPDPVDWMFVCKDDGSKSLLRSAESIFRRIGEECELNADQVLHNQCWRLACLACDSDTMEEAEAYCRDLLRTMPTHPHAIVWAVNRGFLGDREFEACFQALVDDLALKPSIGTILSLCVLHLRFGTLLEAVSLLEEHKEIFEGSRLQKLWKLWRIQVTPPEDAHSPEIKAILTDAPERTELVILEHDAELNGNFGAIVAKGEQALKGEVQPIILGDVCQYLSRSENWVFIADNAVGIVESIGTAAALDMAVVASYNAGRHAEVLSLLDRYKSYFPGENYPPRLKRIRLLALRSMGKFFDAIHDARGLARQTGLLDDYMLFADLYVQKGDVDGVQSVVAEVKAKQGLSAEGALHFSSVLAPHKPEFAKELLSDAVKGGVDSRLIAQAYLLAQRMGVSEDYEELTAQFIAQMQQGRLEGVVAIASEDELRAAIAARQEDLAKREKLYKEAKGPIHFLLEGSNSTLAYCYHQLRQSVSIVKDAFSAPPLMIRHGGRPYFEKFPESPAEIRLHLDVTALLLGHHLGILGEVERCFGKVWLPNEMPLALLQMQESASFYQRDHYDGDKYFLEIVDSGLISIQEIAGKEPEDILLHCVEGVGVVLLWSKDTIVDDKFNSVRVNCRVVAEPGPWP